MNQSKGTSMTQNEINQIVEQAGFHGVLSIGVVMDSKQLETFAKLVAEKEREACAEICDGFYLSWIEIQGRYEFMGEGASECAGAIRARGQE